MDVRQSAEIRKDYSEIFIKEPNATKSTIQELLNQLAPPPLIPLDIFLANIVYEETKKNIKYQN